MTDPYANMPEPRSAGDYPDQYKFQAPGQSIEGTLVDTRWMDARDGRDGCQVLDIQVADGNRWSVFCGPTSLHRQIYNLRPAIGSLIRIAFTGYDGQAKVFQVDVAPGQAPAPQAAPAPAPAPDPFNQPQPAPAAAPAAPWGAQAPAAQAPAAAPWGS